MEVHLKNYDFETFLSFGKLQKDNANVSVKSAHIFFFDDRRSGNF